MKKLYVHTTQQFDANGRTGAWLFMLSPIAGGASYYWYVVEMAKEYFGQPGLAVVLMIASTLTFLGSMIMLLVGRTQTHAVYEVEAKQEEEAEEP